MGKCCFVAYRDWIVDECKKRGWSFSYLEEKAGLNDLQISKLTGIPQSTIYDWKQRTDRYRAEGKNEKAEISALSLIKISKVLKCDVQKLIG